MEEGVGVRFVRPAGWSCESTSSSDISRLTCLEGGNERFVVLSTPDVRESTVVGSERTADELKLRLKSILDFTVDAEHHFVDDQYAVRLSYQGEEGDEGVWWVVLATESATLFRMHLIGRPMDVGEGLTPMPEFRFTEAYPVTGKVGPIVLSARNSSAFGVLVLGLFLLLTLGKKLVVDLPRLFREPGDLFAEFGRGETVLFPLALVLCGVFLMVGVLGLFRDQGMVILSENLVDPVVSQLQSVVEGNEAVDGDPVRAEMVLDGLRGSLLRFYRGYLDDLLWMTPVVWVGVWIVSGTSLFLGGKSFGAQDQAQWRRTLFSCALLSGPSALIVGGSILGSVSSSAAVPATALSVVGVLFLIALGLWGAARLFRLTLGKAMGAWLVAFLFFGLVMGGAIYGVYEPFGKELTKISRPDYSVVDDLRLF